MAMRLRLTIIRHGLPATKILWTVASPAASHQQHAIPASTVASVRTPNVAYGDEGCTIAQLLEDVNEVIPLETAVDDEDEEDAGFAGENDEFGGQWGLEDYVVEVQGHECLHYLHVDGLLRDGDDVVIRPLGIGDLRARRLAGRIQVSTDGRRLIDGVPFGRHFLQRSYSSRPPIRIPPRKRRRTVMSAGWTGNLQNEDLDGQSLLERATGSETRLTLYDGVSELAPSEQGTVIRHPPNLFDDMDDSESDLDAEEAEDDLAEELRQLREEEEQEAEEGVSVDNITIRGTGRKSRMGMRDPIQTSSPARPSIVSTPRTALAKGTEIEATPKSSKSVRFETDSRVQRQPSESDEESGSDEESISDSDSAASSSDNDSSEASDDEDFVSVESDAESDSDSDEKSESEAEREKHATPKSIDVFTPPGQGTTRTRHSNRRKKLRARLQKLKQLGELPADANFDDLKQWEDKHGKHPLTEVVDVTELRESRAQEQTEIMTRRQKLLEDLAAGGIDVDGCSEKENIPPRYTNGKQDQATNSPPAAKDPAETPLVEDEVTSPSGNKRRKLDLSSTKRLLFGSLGVRTPKSKKDEEALRIKLAGSRDKYLPKTTETAADEKEKDEHGDDVDENWQTKIILSATECLYDDIKLTAPSFPFQQRWDGDAAYEVRQRRNSGRRTRKRKTRDWQENYDNSWYDGTGEEEADESTMLNYVDAPSTIQKEDLEATAEDLPTLPSDVDKLPDLAESEATAGAIIAFKQLEISKASNWQPQISAYKVAKVVDVLDDGTLDLVLAKRDREVQPAADDDEEENGVRTYSGFEMPELAEEVDNGARNVAFGDLQEPKLLQRQESVNHDESHSNRSPVSAGDRNNVSTEIPVETELSPAAAPHAAVNGSSQTQGHISHMISDAGFRSGADSDTGLTMSLVEKAAAVREDVDISSSNIENSRPDKSSSVSSSSSDHEEFFSSPPEAILEEQLQYDSLNDVDVDAADKEDGSAADMNDSGFQIAIDNDNDEGNVGLDIGGGDDSNDDVDDSSDDGISLPAHNGDVLGKDTSKTGSVREAITSSAHPENIPATTLHDRDEDTDKGKRKMAMGEETTFLSTTFHEGDESQLQDSFVTAARDVPVGNGNDDNNLSMNDSDSDASSVVPNPFWERDRIALRNAEVAEGKKKATRRADTSTPRSSVSKTQGNGVTKHTNSIEKEQEQHHYADGSSDSDLPSIEVLWASTALSQEPFPPIKTEEDKQLPAAAADGLRHDKGKAAVLPVQSDRSRSRSSSPAFEPVSTTSTSTNRLAPAKVKRRYGRVSSRTFSHLPSSNYIPHQHPPHSDDGNNDDEEQNLDFAEDDNDSDNANDNDNDNDNPNTQQEQQNRANDRIHSPPMMIDLTVSSPLVSPVDDGSDEDFARSQGLPKGPGWVRKHVPPTERKTRRQTRSSTSGGLWSSSPVQAGPSRAR